MMPWGHFAVAFLPYAAYRLVVHRDRPTGRAVLVLLVATQLPDLVDKPLAWTVGVLPSGRMFVHSVLVAVPLVLVLTVAGVRFRREGTAALFSFGVLSHLYADFYRVVLFASPGHRATHLAGLFWPLLPVESDGPRSYLPFFADVPAERYAVVVVGCLVLVAVYAYPRVRRRRVSGRG